MKTSENSSGETRKLDGVVVSAYSKRGVNVFRLIKHRGGKTLIGSSFNMRVYRNGKRVYFQLPSTLAEAKREADNIAAFLDLRSNTLEAAIAKFTPERWERKKGE